MGVVIGVQRFPPIHRGFPLGTLGRVGAAFAIFERFVVRRDQASARAAFDGHVADGHAAFHRQVTDRLAAIFDDIAGAARRAGFTDHGHGDVLGGHTGGKLAGDLDLHVLGFLLDQRLRRQHVFHLRGADPVGQRPKGPMCRGVAVTADNGHAGQGPALLGADDMHDALTHVGHGVVVQAEFLGVCIKGGHLNAAVFGHRRGVGAVQRGRHVVIGHSDGLVRAAHGAARYPQPFKGLRAGHFVDEVTVDVQKAGAIVGLVRDMGIPDFIIERFGGHVVLSRMLCKRRIGVYERRAPRRGRAFIVAPARCGLPRKSVRASGRGRKC